MIGLYQPLYAPGQVLADPAFRPLHLLNNPAPAWREFRILVDMHRTGAHRKCEFTALLSPKFGLKTGLTGDAFGAFIADHLGADICLANPFPQLAYFSFNVWMQGEIAHPGLVERAQDVLLASGVELEIDTKVRHSARELCYSNFWAGTERFWDMYVGEVLVPLADFLTREPTHRAARAVLENTPHTDPSPFLPFIVERLVTTYLASRNNVTIAQYPMSARERCLDDFELDCLNFLAPRVDAAERAGQIQEELVATMELVCRLRQHHTFAYYGSHPHPHTGRPMEVPT